MKDTFKVCGMTITVKPTKNVTPAEEITYWLVEETVEGNEDGTSGAMLKVQGDKVIASRRLGEPIFKVYSCSFSSLQQRYTESAYMQIPTLHVKKF